MDSMGALAILGLTIYLASRALYPPHDMTPGDFGRFLGLTATLYPYLKSFNGLWGGLQNAMAAAERCYDILDTKNPMLDTQGSVEVGPFKKSLEFKAVGFHYLPGHPILRNISFSLRKGEVLALVGPSGGGKTTLVDLIPRFYDPTEGKILWDGKDLREIKLESLRSHIGIVTQETILFHDSIQKNIAYGRPGATFWDVQAAAKGAFAREFIANTPQGFNTLVGDRGVKLSGGQRQRLAIARALLKDPPLMILDEATSALDTQSESLVQKALNGLIGHRTSVVIAHRLSTVRRANRIMVVDKGRIVEEGKHSYLLAKGGLYAKLYKMQFKTPGESQD
jgi:subfamily B ATP-binding cassette protein MsbA